MITINDEGARKLIASILKQAAVDYGEKEDCPAWCPQVNCTQKKSPNRIQCEVRQFIQRDWCATLCEGIDIDYNQYKETLMRKKLTPELTKYIESELRNYKQTCLELEQLKLNIIHETPEQQEGHSSDVSKPVEQKVAKILQDRKIKRYEEIVQAIKTTYEKCDRDKQQLIELKYWQNRYTDKGIAEKLCISYATFKNWKKSIVMAISIELGYI